MKSGDEQIQPTGSSYLYATATQEPDLCTSLLSCWSGLRSYSLRLIIIQGGGMRGKDEMSRIEAFAEEPLLRSRAFPFAIASLGPDVNKWEGF